MKILVSLYRLLSRIRRLVAQKIFGYLVTKRANSVGMGLTVNARSRVTKNTTLGNNVNFNGLTIAGNGTVQIGDNFHSGEECLFITSIHNYDSGTAIPYDDTTIDSNILIEDNVWLGSRVIVLGKVTIGEGAIIQAGSVVVSSIPKYAIAGGHPAKPFKQRNIEHYEALKAKKHFF